MNVFFLEEGRERGPQSSRSPNSLVLFVLHPSLEALFFIHGFGATSSLGSNGMCRRFKWKSSCKAKSDRLFVCVSQGQGGKMTSLPQAWNS